MCIFILLKNIFFLCIYGSLFSPATLNYSVFIRCHLSFTTLKDIKIIMYANSIKLWSMIYFLKQINILIDDCDTAIYWSSNFCIVDKQYNISLIFAYFIEALHLSTKVHLLYIKKSCAYPRRTKSGLYRVRVLLSCGSNL